MRIEADGVIEEHFAPTSEDQQWGIPLHVCEQWRDLRVLEVDPTTPPTVFAGTAGGVFMSADSGVTWTASNTGLTSINISALGVDPANGNNVFAGTDEDGVFKSTNGGTSWTLMSTGITDLDIRALAIDRYARA